MRPGLTKRPVGSCPWRDQRIKQQRMKLFSNSDGDAWVATVRSEAGLDFKGRHHLYFHPADAEDHGVELLDVRWNSEGTAQRTLATMSDVELRRRLRSALGRAAKPTLAAKPPLS